VGSDKGAFGRIGRGTSGGSDNFALELFPICCGEYQRPTQDGLSDTWQGTLRSSEADGRRAGSNPTPAPG